jgi:eukaryotic-like serine/threonine-protein kinase
LSATDAQINRVPAPFAEIIRNAYARRWSLAQISNALKPALPIAPVPPLPPPPAPAPASTAPPVAAAPPIAPVSATPRPPAPAPPAPPPARPQPAAAAPPPPPRPPVAPRPAPAPIPEPRTLQFEDLEEPEEKKKPVLLYVGLAFVVLALLGWLLFRPHSAPAPATSANAPAVSAPAPAPQASPATVPTTPTKPLATKPGPYRSGVKGSPVVTTAVGVSSDGRSLWRVVAYTYHGESKAQNMASEIKSRHPDLDAEVFSPGKTGSYLVTIGGPMSRDDADKMREKARHEGLPGDTYIQNFKH